MSNSGAQASSQATHRLYSRQEAASSSGPKRAPDAPVSAADVVHVKGIAICGWTIETSRGSIADSKTIDELSDRLKIPVPEMPFDKNALRIKHEASGWQYVFNFVGALQSVEGVNQAHRTLGLDVSDGGISSSSTSNGGGAAGSKRAQERGAGSMLGDKPKKSRRVKVAYADEWGKSREPASGTGVSATSATHNTNSNFGADVAKAVASAANDPTSTIALARDYDWTYSCTWPGQEQLSKSDKSTKDEEDAEDEKRSPKESMFERGSDPARDRIPIERLGPPPNAGLPGAPKPEPILFYDDLVLFEDELGDNGSSMLNVKVRVMPSGFLILQRFFLRVDDVLFRVFDTRMYVGFEEEEGLDRDQHPSSAKSGASLPPATSAAATARPTMLPSTDSTTRQLRALSLGPTRRQMMATSSPAPHAPPVLAKKNAQSQFRVIRECSGCQATYAEVKSLLPPYKSNDLSPLTDPGWVAQNLEKIAQRRAQALFRRQGQRAIGDPAAVLAMAERPGQAEYRGPGSHQLGPATLPGSNDAIVPNRILGEVRHEVKGRGEGHAEEEDTQWEGEGARVDVAILGGKDYS